MIVNILPLPEAVSDLILYPKREEEMTTKEKKKLLRYNRKVENRMERKKLRKVGDGKPVEVEQSANQDLEAEVT